jgi:hypothetical protein
MNSDSVKMSDVCEFLARRIIEGVGLHFAAEAVRHQSKMLDRTLDKSLPEDERWFHNLSFETPSGSCSLSLAEQSVESAYVKDSNGNAWKKVRLSFEVSWPSHGSNNDVENAMRRLKLYSMVAELALAAKKEFGDKDIWKIVD